MELKKYKLGEISEIVNGATPSTKDSDNYDGTIIWITPKDLSDQKQKYIKRGQRTITEKGFNSCSAQMIPPCNILMSSRAPIGLLAINQSECCTNQGFKNLLLDKTLCDVDFMYYYLKFHIKEIEALGTGTTFSEVSKSSLQSFEVKLPNINIQKNIAKCLSDIDRKIELNKQINDNLEAMAKQLYDYWFVQFDFPNEEGKPYKSSGGAMVWNEKLKREIPEGWSDCVLCDICEMYQPKTLGLNELSEDREYKVYGANGIIGHYSSYNHENSEITMACRGNSCGTINRTSPKSWITGNAMVIKLRNKEIHNEYIKHALKYANVKGAISGSGQPQLTRENLSILKLVQPKYATLKAFSKKVAAIVAMELEIEEENDSLTKQRDELLPLLMNGQASVN